MGELAVHIRVCRASQTADMKSITVIIPTHHRPDYLRRALASVCAQDYPREHFEVIVVTSPADRGEDVVHEFAENGLDVRSVTVSGDPMMGRNPSAKRNLGAQLARGDWVAFLDDDCEAEPCWLSEASRFFDEAVAVEGAKVIPPPPVPTLTYKGLKLFERPGGYQSCNIFYRRDLFLEIGGFDLRFPFYLEDSDLAWTVLDRGHAIPHAAKAVVKHPVIPPAPWRMLDGAKRAILLPLLKRKHPQQYRRSGFGPVSRTDAIYLVAWLLLIMLTAWAGWRGLLVGLALLIAITLLDSYRRFRGCRVLWNEFWVTTMLLPITPPIRLIQYLRGLFRHRSASTTLPPLPSLAPELA